MAWVQILGLPMGPKSKISRTFKFYFSKLKIKIFFEISKKYCQSLGLDNILFRFYIMTLQNISLFMVRHYFIAIPFSSYQPALKLVWCLLYGNKSFWIR